MAVLGVGLLLACVTRDATPGPGGCAPALASGAWVVAGVAYTRGDAPGVARAAAMAGRLDPTWSTPWIYGGMMTRRLGAPSTAEALLTDGAAVRPLDPTIPALLGAIRWTDHEDAAGAASWYARAAAIPGAPDDLGAIAAALEGR